jgi:eukaryotic-like serine/threonine-protein kinase
MTLSTGTKLGPYEIQSPLGAGGMGEVYRARDSRLGREVAIKVLPESFGGDPDRLRRFEQEARAVAALNHPNILAVHDIGTQEKTPYIVTELLEGRTLREQLEEGALPVRKAMQYAQQIANGLAAAHDKGIVHRDLKPENIFCTKDGRIKILDFGLAKQTTSRTAPATMSGATATSAQTQAGVVMGTAGYMSPEQVRGATTDHRSDIFALGAILYEMLTGQRAFKRDTAAETMTAILKEEPRELTGTNPAIPPGLERIVRRCLEKQPEQRFQSVADLGFAIEALSGTTSAAVPAAQGRPSRTWRTVAMAGVVLAALVAGWFAHRSISGRSPILAFHRVTYSRGTIFNARFSPDGKTILYGAALEGRPVQIYAASKEIPESRPIDVKQSTLLSVSATGELAILTNARRLPHYEFQGTLATMPMGGGAPREILRNVTAADWAPDGQSMAIVHMVEGKYRLEYPQGKVLFETTGSISHARISPDGKMVAFLHHPSLGDDRGDVMIVDGTSKPRILSDGWESEEGLAWSTTKDEILFSAIRAGSDLELLAVTPSGKTRVVLTEPGGVRLMDISPDGRMIVSYSEVQYIVAASVAGGPERDLSWLDASFQPSLSADGKWILFSEGSADPTGQYSVCLRKTDGSPIIRLGEGLAYSLSPDGTWAWALLQKDPPEIELLPTGPGELRRPERSNIESYSAMGWMPSSQEYLFAGNEPGHGSRIYIQSIDNGKARPITVEGFAAAARIPISPDGKRFAAYDQNHHAWDLCQVQDGKCGPLAGSEEHDLQAQWSADGKYIYAGGFEPVAGFWRIEISTGHRQLWKQISPADPVGTGNDSPTYITPDGKSFATGYNRLLDQLYIADSN